LNGCKVETLTIAGTRRAGLSLASACLALFLLLWLLVASHVTDDWERTILLSLRPVSDPNALPGPNWLPGYVRDVTALGSFAVLSLLFLAAVGYLAAYRDHWTAVRIALPILSGWMLSETLKAIVGRARPGLATTVEVFSASFPSGHALLSMISYLTVGLILAERAPTSLARALCIAVPLILTFAIGLSRLYLGIHYPTDVIGGWLLGLAWVFGWRAWRRPGEV